MREGFRLPGYGGAAVFLRSHAVPARTLETEAPTLVFDVGLLSPDEYNQYLNRPAGDGFVERLSAFFFHAAADFHPERSLDTFSDETLGLTIAVRSSTDQRVELEFSLAEDATESDSERDEMDFETSRVVLATSAQSVGRLSGRTSSHFDGEA
ncbi:hypothetical protein FFI94_029265 [Rhodococcus sp. KBS0724]|jgi:Fe-S cluster assembly iron-binding protein IscA|uniref:hypothetical protein n=1 Tax=Rhodococcus sp. KBS0724 TaxID=1179674 RepID=UPI00110D6D3E|nr:hypothetical protein [Rhodococcus sp. KBS0724]TSD49842.1 hypothetical protein FFI94_029265 [Rhodococcus sp. KBS0724]